MNATFRSCVNYYVPIPNLNAFWQKKIMKFKEKFQHQKQGFQSLKHGLHFVGFQQIGFFTSIQHHKLFFLTYLSQFLSCSSISTICLSVTASSWSSAMICADTVVSSFSSFWNFSHSSSTGSLYSMFLA